MKRIHYLLLVAVSLVFGLGCQDKTVTGNGSAANSDSVSTKVDSAGAAKVASADSARTMGLAKEIIDHVANGDLVKIADYIHPVKGIRFSPYTYVDTAEHKHFTADAFREQVTKNVKKKILWGTYDPLSEDILLTVEGYFKEFGYDKDYFGGGKLGYNETIGTSTVLNNIAEIYPEGVFVEAYWAPEDEEKAPYEWGSIRLVFETHQGKQYLVAWVHDAWNT